MEGQGTNSAKGQQSRETSADSSTGIRYKRSGVEPETTKHCRLVTDRTLSLRLLAVISACDTRAYQTTGSRNWCTVLCC